jgi:hypothetical protein
MKGGALSIPGLGVPGLGVPSLNAAKQQAADAAKAKAQGAATSVMSSDAVQSSLSKAEGVAGSVGLGDQFAAAKDATIGAVERATGLQLSGSTTCKPERIDVPTVSDVLLATADNPYDATTRFDSYFSYVIVDSRNPPPSATTSKTTLWYISIVNAIFLAGLGAAYSQLK